MSLKSKWTGLKEIWSFENRLSLITGKLFFPGEKLQVYRANDIEFISDHAAGDANGAREILTSPMYRDLLEDIPRDRPFNVLDLGANNGGFPLLLVSLGFELKKVVSVELNPRTWVRLHFNLHRNLNCEIEALNAAICSKNGPLNIVLGEGDVSDNIYRMRTNDNGSTFQIQGTTFDRLFECHFPRDVVDICKIDIEGAEFEVFRGAEHQSLRRCRFVIMEIHERDGDRAAELIPVIEKLNFSRLPGKPAADPTVHLFVNNSIK